MNPLGYNLVTLASLGVIGICSVLLLIRRLLRDGYPQELPRLGQAEGVSWKEMRKRFQLDCTGVFQNAYENYSKKGRAVLIPVYGPFDEVILPPSWLQWLCRQPDSVASSLHAQIDSIGLDHSLGHKFAHDPWGGMLFKTDLNSILEIVCAIMNDEIGRASDQYLGVDIENWKEIDLFQTCRMLAGRATLRFTLGDSPEGRKLCRDDDFIRSCYSVLDGMIEVAGTLAGTPRYLRRFHGPWASRSMSSKIQDLKQRFAPVHRERLSILEREASSEKHEQSPRDIVHMMMQYAIKERPSEAYNLEDMTKRLAVSNFGTMHQTVIALHNLFLDILDSDAEFNTVSLLREEVTRVIMAGDDDDADTSSRGWSRAKIASMARFDSVARESLRLNTFVGRSVQRRVIAPQGLVLEDGLRLPRGTMVSILAHQAQTDSDSLENPEKYDPFRFSRVREANRDPSDGRLGLSNLSFVSTSANYLPFSHGRHACPGRFLVDFEIKMTMSYALMNYDLEFPSDYGGKRPPITWFSGFGIPPLASKVRVRRRGMKKTWA
ncbi:cytochrome P450 [Xylariomycetidae sp. FL2044]|nr:cytochrome P450 [Xylariomycetidae sp. FL2044]